MKKFGLVLCLVGVLVLVGCSEEHKGMDTISFDNSITPQVVEKKQPTPTVVESKVYTVEVEPTDVNEYSDYITESVKEVTATPTQVEITAEVTSNITPEVTYNMKNSTDVCTVMKVLLNGDLEKVNDFVDVASLDALNRYVNALKDTEVISVTAGDEGQFFVRCSDKNTYFFSYSTVLDQDVYKIGFLSCAVFDEPEDENMG